MDLPRLVPSDGKQGAFPLQHVLARDFTAPAVNRRWVSDTTELSAGGTRLFLAAIIDLFSRFVVGWAISTINDRHLVRRTLEMAIKRRGPGAGLLCHSDQGSPYTSEDYQRVLGGLGVTVSMSRRGNCHDNAPMESFFSTLKFELGENFDSVSFAKEELLDYIEVFFNHERRHSALGYVSPADFEKAARIVRAVGYPRPSTNNQRIWPAEGLTAQARGVQARNGGGREKRRGAAVLSASRRMFYPTGGVAPQRTPI